MSMLDAITVRCGLCGTETEFDLILSTHSFGSPDLDTRSPAMRGAVLEAQVQRCSGCGYCASDVSSGHPDASKVINGQGYRLQLNDPTYPELANSFLCQSILLRELRSNYAEAAWACIKAAWVCDDYNYPGQAIACRRRAEISLAFAEIRNLNPPVQDETNVAVRVDLLRRSQQVYAARKLISEKQGKITDDLIKCILDYQKDLLDKNDFSRHTIAEARSQLKKSAPGVTFQHAPNITPVAREEPEYVASSGSSDSSGIGLGSSTTPSALQAPQRSEDQVGAQPIGDNAANVRNLRIGLKERLEPLRFYLITVVVAVVGIGLGRVGSPIDPPLSFLFAIPGAFAAVFAFLLTVGAVSEYAPVLIERSPAPARPLLAPIIIAIWASIPILIFYLNHGPSFNFHGLLKYFEFRGAAVAKLFVVGIIASLFGHRYALPGCKRIQPYILIPVISMFIAFWLSPDSDDPALEITGLTAGLVYYIGVLAAALLGYFLGEVMRNNKSSK